MDMINNIKQEDILSSLELGLDGIYKLKLSFSGKEKSIFGVLDSYLSNNFGFLSSVASQCSYHAYKA